MRWNAPFMAVKAALKRLALKPFRTLVRIVAVTALAITCWIFARRIIESRPVEATSTDPAIAVRQEQVVHGLRWGLSYEAALAQAKATDTPVLIYFGSATSYEGGRLENEVFPHADVVPMVSNFVRVQLYVDRVAIQSLSKADRAALANANVGLQLDLMDEITTPCLVIVTPRGEFVTKRQGYQNPRDMAAFLKRALAQARHRSNARATNP
jgi:Thioredoxin-like